MKFVYELNRAMSQNKKGRGSLRSGNEMLSANDRLCPPVRAELTSYLRTLSASTGYEEGKKADHVPFSKEHPCHITVVICPPTRRRMDAPNWYPTIKALIDGLTDVNIFVDDNNDVITSMKFVPGPKTENKKYRIEIIIQEGRDELWQTYH